MTEAIPEAQYFPLLLTLLAAVGLGAGLFFLGDRRARSWAVPVAAAILFYGLSTYYALPDWAVIGGVLVTPLLFHHLMRQRLEGAARKVERLQLDGAVLRRLKDFTGKHVAVWTTAPEGPPRVSIDPLAAPMVLALDFEGEAEDDFRVVLRGQVPKHCPGSLVAQHEQSDKDFAGVLSEQEPIEGLPGQSAGTRVRSLPPDFAFRILDMGTMIAVDEILRLRTEKREVYLHIDGPQIRVVATDVYSQDDIIRLLKAVSVVFDRLRAVGLEGPQ